MESVSISMTGRRTVFFLVFICLACENSDRLFLGKDYYEKELALTIGTPHTHNVVDNSTEIIKDEKTAVHIAESILSGIYGDDIKKQRPYEIYKFGKYWTIGGTIPKGIEGGTFLIVLDATDSRVIRISHGK